MSDLNQEDKAVLLDHDYDGIQELDHPLPKWWLGTFWITVIFAIGYFAYYIVGSGPSLEHEYSMDMEEISAIKEKYLESLSQFKHETYKSYSQTPEMVTMGKDIFDVNCVGCHKENGAGDIGPNLTDEYWLYAQGTAETIFPFILSGNPTNGMPAWAEQLKEDELYAVTAYIMSIQGMKHDNPKDPQGEKVQR